MHGLVNRALQRFVETTMGAATWHQLAATALGPGFPGFEALLSCDDDATYRLLSALEAQSGTPRAVLLEDLGVFLVSHPSNDALRRLLRFGGETFCDFVLDLEDLPERVQLAVPDLVLPAIEVLEHAPGRFCVVVGPGLPGFGRVLSGVLRALADDYGALVLSELQRCDEFACRIALTIAEARFADGREFRLAVADVGR
jgi:hypothetical protein